MNSPENNQKLAMMLRGGDQGQQPPQQPEMSQNPMPQQIPPPTQQQLQQLMPVYQQYAQQAQSQGEQPMPFQQFVAEAGKRFQQNQASLLQQQPGINQQMNRPPQQPMPPQAPPM